MITSPENTILSWVKQDKGYKLLFTAIVLDIVGTLYWGEKRWEVVWFANIQYNYFST